MMVTEHRRSSPVARLVGDGDATQFLKRVG
jgi:hypothetical protein